MSVQNTLNAALYAKMNGDSTLTSYLAGTTAIYFVKPPDNAALDYIVWNYQGGGDENATPRRTKDLVVNIKAVSVTGQAKAGTIDARIDALLTELEAASVEA